MIIVKTEPAFEPITLTEVKEHLVDVPSEDDALISEQIRTAREWVEIYLQRPLIVKTMTYYGNALCGKLELSPMLQSVTSVKYIDCDGVQQTLAETDYIVSKNALVGHIVPAYGASWPSVRRQPESVEVEFVAGYATRDAIPNPIKQAMKLLVGDMYLHREETVVGANITQHKAVDSLLERYRIITL